MIVRPERHDDEEHVAAVVASAFSPSSGVPALLEDLRRSAAWLDLAFVGVDDEAIVAYAAFSQAWVDDCGYGPPELDVANAVYMVLFDQHRQGEPRAYDAFRDSFLDGYVAASGPPLLVDSVEGFVDHRVEALAGWLADLDTAPVGIRTAPTSWHTVLEEFVVTYRSSRRS